MYGILMFFFIIICLFLAIIILIQQGKGDMGLGGLGGSTQMLFGGSGGQEFFENITWVLGAIFIFGSLGLAVLKSKQTHKSRLGGYAVKKQTPVSKPATPVEQNQAPTETTENQ